MAYLPCSSSDMGSSDCYLQDLDRNLLAHVFSFLQAQSVRANSRILLILGLFIGVTTHHVDASQLCVAACASRAMKDAIADPILWRNLYQTLGSIHRHFAADEVGVWWKATYR